MANKDKKEQLWEEAKTKCRLSNEAISMAKEMGLNPLSLIKNIPSPKQQWKAPVEDWVREIYRERKERSEKRKRQKQTPSEQTQSDQTVN